MVLQSTTPWLLKHLVFMSFKLDVIECGLNNIEANRILTRYHNISLGS